MTKNETKKPWRGLTLGWGAAGPNLLFVEGLAASCGVTLEPWPWVKMWELTKLYEVIPHGTPEAVAKFLARFDEHFAPEGYDAKGNCEVHP
jgi:hypothetical protein